MRLVTLFLIAALAASTVGAASYLTTYGRIVDPIMIRFRPSLWPGWQPSGAHPYSGDNLEPGADLTDADLAEASLNHADLRDADLTDANLTGATLIEADLTGATLTGFGMPPEPASVMGGIAGCINPHPLAQNVIVPVDPPGH